jgi:hypothetical protein
MAPPRAVERHDLPELGWWLIARVLENNLDAKRTAVIATLMRVIAAFGQDVLPPEAALREAELRGRLMHGLPPRDEAEWALAEATFSASALETMRQFEELAPGR